MTNKGQCLIDLLLFMTTLKNSFYVGSQKGLPLIAPDNGARVVTIFFLSFLIICRCIATDGWRQYFCKVFLYFAIELQLMEGNNIFVKYSYTLPLNCS